MDGFFVAYSVVSSQRTFRTHTINNRVPSFLTCLKAFISREVFHKELAMTRVLMIEGLIYFGQLEIRKIRV